MAIWKPLNFIVVPQIYLEGGDDTILCYMSGVNNSKTDINVYAASNMSDIKKIKVYKDDFYLYSMTQAYYSNGNYTKFYFWISEKSTPGNKILKFVFRVYGYNSSNKWLKLYWTSEWWT